MYYTCSLIEKSKCFSLSILPETIDSQVITDLGFQTGKDKDKWAKLNHHLFKELPVVDDALGYMMCEVQSQMDAGTHFVFLAKVVDAKKSDSGKPMTYAYYHNVLKQSAPAKAPTYRKEEKWVCSVCGYVYDGDDFENEPDDYVCPVCGAKKDMFKLQ